jgi:hypothetical protein
MGYYINPKSGESKEQWLQKNAREYVYIPTYDKVIGEGLVPLVLLDNGFFTACGIAYSQREYEEFADPHDARPKTVFGANKAAVLDVCPEAKEVLNR